MASPFLEGFADELVKQAFDVGRALERSRLRRSDPRQMSPEDRAQLATMNKEGNAHAMNMLDLLEAGPTNGTPPVDEKDKKKKPEHPAPPTKR